MSKQLLATLLAACTALSVQASGLYSCTDRSGKTVYTQNPTSAVCQKQSLGRPEGYTSAETDNTDGTADTGSSASSSYTALDEAQQRLQQAQQALEEGRKVRYGNERNYAKYQERIRGLEEAVTKAQQDVQDMGREQVAQ